MSLDRLAERCRAAGIDVKIATVQPDPDEPATPFTPDRVLTMNIPAARQTRRVRIVEFPNRQEWLTKIGESDIPESKFIEGYDAIWSSSKHFVEGQLALATPRPGAVSQFLHAVDAMTGHRETHPEDDNRGRGLTLRSPDGALTLSVGGASIEHSAMVRGATYIHVPPPVTVRVDGLAVTTHDAAKSALEELANGVLFQIDRLTGAAAYLAPQSGPTPRRRERTESGRLAFPRFAYDSAPMALYWHARSSDTNRLRFLGYYQVLEHYFPVYATAQAQHQLQAILKDELFDASKETDIAKVLGVAMRLSSRAGGFDEYAQLEATIRACVDENVLREFIAASQDRSDALAKPTVLPKSKVDGKSDLLGEVSRRMHDIRNAIVHTKSGDIRERILPFSPQDIALGADVELIRHVAIRVLNRGSHQRR